MNDNTEKAKDAAVLKLATGALEIIAGMSLHNGEDIQNANAMQEVAQNALLDIQEAAGGEPIDDLPRKRPKEFYEQLSHLRLVREPPNLKIVE